MEKDTERFLLIIFLSVFVLIAIIRISVCTRQVEKQSELIEAQREEICSYEDRVISIEMEDEDLKDKAFSQELQITLMKDDYMFYSHYAACVNENDAYYHQPSCEYFSSENFYIYNVDLAESYGYKPCPVCW